MLEKQIERRMVARMAARGAMVFKFVSPGRQGVPDRIALLPGGRIVFIELKTAAGKLSPVQQNIIKRMRDLGADVRVVYGDAEAQALADELTGGKDGV